MTSYKTTARAISRGLRSSRWLVGNDEVALLHRVAFASAGIRLPRTGDAPIIGISNSSSELNPCNLPLSALVDSVKQGVQSSGGIAVEFPTMSLGEDLMKPSAMLYRNLVSIEIEEMVRAYPLDGIVILANCDKTIPGALMGALSANIPTVLVTGGAREPAIFGGKRIGTGTDLWRLSEKRRVGQMSDDEWHEFEDCLGCSSGACNTMGTASTMAILSEVMGFMVSGASTIPTGNSRSFEAAEKAGAAIVRCVRSGVTPSKILTLSAMRNSAVVLHASGGSTNAIIHLLALAGRLGLDITLDDLGDVGRNVPVIVDVEPSGSGLIQDFDAAGGVPVLLRELSAYLELDAQTIEGRTIGEIIEHAELPKGVIRKLSEPIRNGGSFKVVKGTLAPDGAVIKVSAASDQLLHHTGRAVVFNGYNDMMSRIDDPNLDVDPDSVLVLSGCGPVGVPGMPEWGMIPIPSKLAKEGVNDMVRITDARMSGTSFGTVVLHVSPEAAIDGPLGLVRDGDQITLDVVKGVIDLIVDSEELEHRGQLMVKENSPHLRGWPALYRDHVLQASQGCDLDFLRAPTPDHRTFIEPVIGRS